MSKLIPYDIKGSTEDELIKSFENPIIVFVGAGLSIPAPTCAPSWWTLTQELLDSFFGKVSGVKEIKEMGDLDFKINRQPEEIFENYSAILGNRFYEVFNVLQEGRPNMAHIALARLMKHKKIHSIITTNFDRFLEEALESEAVSYNLIVTNREFSDYISSNFPENTLLKIHGTIERPDTIVSIASQYKTSKGFSIPKAEVFRYLLSKYECLFLGYSGWDYLHNNYRTFWEKSSPMIKGIIWNVRPGEKEGPPLREIIPIDSFRFTTGELPITLIEIINKKGIDNKNLTSLDREASDQEFKHLTEKRKIWLDNWIEGMPLPYIYGLTLTDIQNYSKEWQDYLKDGWKETKQNVDLQMDYNQQITELMAKLNSGELQYGKYQEKITEIMAKKEKKVTPEEKRQKGVFNIRPVLKLLIDSILNIEEKYFEEGIDALILSILYLSGKEILKETSKLLSDEDIKEIHTIIDNKIDDSSSLEEIDKIIRNQFDDIFKRCSSLNCDKKVLAKLELGIAAIWMQLMKGKFGEENKAFTAEEADYLTYKFPSNVYKKIRDIYNPIIDEINNFNSSYRQLIFSNLTQLAEAGDDLELAEYAVKSSLKETEGKVTEATLPPIPEALGGFYDRRKDWKNAIYWYDLALEGLLFVNIRAYADKVTYRAMFCNEKLGNKKRALEIGLRYLSDYSGIELAFAPIHKKHARDMISRLSNELGYSSIEEAISDLIK